jgi:hypothetical protein
VRMIGTDLFGLARKLDLWRVRGAAEAAAGALPRVGSAQDGAGAAADAARFPMQCRYEVMQIGGAAGYPFSGLCVHRIA